ncbi:hypothetical protein Pelo_13184 [Pelomyxa schiedti]|nr:hypothetical protein Pelo_13184 [Pelomyxa schiedti]
MSWSPTAGSKDTGRWPPANNVYIVATPTLLMSAPRSPSSHNQHQTPAAPPPPQTTIGGRGGCPTMRLLELPYPDAINEQSFRIEGDSTGQAILHTSKGTYTIKSVETSNSLLFGPVVAVDNNTTTNTIISDITPNQQQQPTTASAPPSSPSQAQPMAIVSSCPSSPSQQQLTQQAPAITSTKTLHVVGDANIYLECVPQRKP